MPIPWTLTQLLFLAGLAVAIALLVASEGLEARRAQRPVRRLAEGERAAWVMRHLPPASRAPRPAAEAMRRIAMD
jgi:hypothetical protein